MGERPTFKHYNNVFSFAVSCDLPDHAKYSPDLMVLEASFTCVDKRWVSYVSKLALSSVLKSRIVVPLCLLFLASQACLLQVYLLMRYLVMYMTLLSYLKLVASLFHKVWMILLLSLPCLLVVLILSFSLKLLFLTLIFPLSLPLLLVTLILHFVRVTLVVLFFSWQLFYYKTFKFF